MGLEFEAGGLPIIMSGRFFGLQNYLIFFLNYFSAFLVGVHIIWPTASPGYDDFRTQTIWFSLLVSLVQVSSFK